MGKLIDDQNIIMDGSTRNEHRLFLLNKFVKMNVNSVNQDLKKQFANHVAKSDRPVVFDFLRVIMFGNKDHESSARTLWEMFGFWKEVESFQDVVLKRRSIFKEKFDNKAGRLKRITNFQKTVHSRWNCQNE